LALKARVMIKAEGQTVKKVTAHDPFGYDRGFILEFESGLTLEVEPVSCPLGDGWADRISIKENKPVKTLMQDHYMITKK